MQKEPQTGVINSTPSEWVRSPLTLSKSALALFLIDRLLKLWAFSHPLQTLPILGKFFTFTLFLNFQVTFGIPILWNGYWTWLMGIVLVLLISKRVYSATYHQKKMTFALDILILGASSNFMDRLIHTNTVIDYLHFWPWSYINIADTMIVLGIYLLYRTTYGTDRGTTRT